MRLGGIGVAAMWMAAAKCAAGAPLMLAPANPHYFLFRGKATVLVTSGEHYGSVINLDFDYRRYLDELARNHLNLTRIWVGPYREVPGSFKIANNTLAPRAERFIAPWPRTEVRGAADGGNRFNLKQWNPAYFRRLHDFLEQASRRGIVVEVNLFCPYYEDSMWRVSPLNAENNVNGTGKVPRTKVLTLEDSELVAVEDAMTRKIVSELNGFDNLYYEICNEPYFGGVTDDWQRHISGVIASTEQGLQKHLISQNVANGSKVVSEPEARVGLFNFHYSRPPASVGMNFGLNRAIGNNETGFDGPSDAVYRIEGWDFLVAGGTLYNNLDYSFAVGYENGTFHYPETTPGGGSAALREQLGILKDLFDSFDVAQMKPMEGAARFVGEAGASVRVLARPGNEYVVYLHEAHVDKSAKGKYVVDSSAHERTIAMELPAGKYEQFWLETRTGAHKGARQFEHSGGNYEARSPVYREDCALVLRRIQ